MFNLFKYSAASVLFLRFVTYCIPMRYKENAKKMQKKCIFFCRFSKCKLFISKGTRKNNDSRKAYYYEKHMDTKW